MSIVLYTLLSVVLVSLISVVAVLPFFLKKSLSQKTLAILLSFSVGSLLGTVFIHFLPEAMENGYSLNVALTILFGFLVFFILEKLIHFHHARKTEQEHGHGHAYHLAPLNIIGDGIHNLLDGIVIAGSYVTSIQLGIAATISVIFHEIPQEVADMGILLYAGLKKGKALSLNFLSAITALIGAGIGLFLADQVHGFTEFIIPFAAGNFLYIAAVNLVPEIHRHCKSWDLIIHVISILAGIGITLLVLFFAPEQV